MQAAPVCEVRLAIRHREEQTSTLQPNARPLQRNRPDVHATPRALRLLAAISALARLELRHVSLDPLEDFHHVGEFDLGVLAHEARGDRGGQDTRVPSSVLRSAG
jgi:hypothetical protein